MSEAFDAAYLSTGVELLDRRFGGGVPAGRFVAFVAPPESQSEVILESIVDAQPCSFVSARRSRDEVEAQLEASRVDLSNARVRGVSPDEIVDNPEGTFADIPTEGYLILEGGATLGEASRADRNRVLSVLRDRLLEQSAAGILHCVGRDPEDVDALTLSRADIVWWLQLVVTSLSIETRLIVPKFRGGQPLTEPVKLLLTDEVSIDTSRDIA